MMWKVEVDATPETLMKCNLCPIRCEPKNNKPKNKNKKISQNLFLGSRKQIERTYLTATQVNYIKLKVKCHLIW